MLATIAAEELFHYALIFLRLGSAFILLPGFGEIYIPARTRLATALVISFVMTSVLSVHLPPLPLSVTGLAGAMISEIVIGIFIGGIGRTIQATLHMGGMMIAFQSGLASSLLFDPNQGSQGSVIGNFLTIVGVTLLFTTNLHHIILTGIADSYTVFEAGIVPFTGDLANFASKTLSDGFTVAFKIASPQIVIGLTLYLSSGIMARLMPNMQVFFVIIPLQIIISFFIMMITLSSGIMWYLGFFEDSFIFMTSP